MSLLNATNAGLVAHIFTTSCVLLSVIISLTFFKIIVSADVHQNPGSSLPDNSSQSTCIYLLDKGFNIMHLNIQSLKQKFDIIEAEVQQYDIVVFTETWFSPKITDDDILISNFCKPYLAVRLGRLGDGVAIYVRDNLYSKLRDDLSIVELEALWEEIKINKHTILIGGFYRPPDANASYFNLLEESIDRANNTSIINIIMTGDFNTNVLNKNTIQPLIDSYGFHQLINEPIYTETSRSLIDLMSIKNPGNVITSFVDDPFITEVVCYHCPIVLVLNFKKLKCNSYQRRVWNYDNGDYHKFRSLLTSHDWNKITNTENFDETSEQLTNEVVREIRKARNQHDKKMINKLNSNDVDIKSWFKYTKQLLKLNSSVYEMNNCTLSCFLFTVFALKVLGM